MFPPAPPFLLPRVTPAFVIAFLTKLHFVKRTDKGVQTSPIIVRKGQLNIQILDYICIRTLIINILDYWSHLSPRKKIVMPTWQKETSYFRKSIFIPTYIFLYSCCSHLEHRASVKPSFQVSCLILVCRIPWKGDQPVARPLPTQNDTNTE
jgi:hypothetical protein